MEERLIQFFDKFVLDFKSFDGSVIASRYLAPYTAISSDKKISLYKEHTDIVAYFTSILAAYKKQGVKYCTYNDFDFSAIGANVALATMDWQMMKEDGARVSSWRESYVLILSDGVFKIITSIDHSPN